MLQYLDNLKPLLWKSFELSSRDIINGKGMILDSAVTKFISDGGGMPKEGILTHRSKALERAILEGQVMTSVSDSRIESSKDVISPYASRHEYGGGIGFTPQSKRAMFAKLKRMGLYQRDYQAKGFMPKRPFISPAIKHVSDKIWIDAVKQRVNEQFTNITREMIIGK